MMSEQHKAVGEYVLEKEKEKAYQQGRVDERADTIEIVHRFFMDEMDTIETYIDEDDGVSEIYKDQKKAKYLLNLNKRLCERLKQQKKCDHYCHSCEYNCTTEDEEGLYYHHCKLETHDKRTETHECV